MTNSPVNASRTLVLCLGTLVASATMLGCDPVDDLEQSDELIMDSEGDEDERPTEVVSEPARDPGAAEPAGAAEPLDDLAADSAPLKDAGWGTWISEETPPTTCNAGRAVTAVDCWGSNCDEVQLYCGTHGNSDGNSSWTPYFSEEGTSHRVCSNGSFVTGIACRGWWCDEISLECTNLGISHSSCSWSGYHDSDDPWFVADAGKAVAGVQCLGAYCDSMRFYQCAL